MCATWWNSGVFDQLTLCRSVLPQHPSAPPAVQWKERDPFVYASGVVSKSCAITQGGVCLIQKPVYEAGEMFNLSMGHFTSLICEVAPLSKKNKKTLEGGNHVSPLPVAHPIGKQKATAF